MLYVDVRPCYFSYRERGGFISGYKWGDKVFDETDSNTREMIGSSRIIGVENSFLLTNYEAHIVHQEYLKKYSVEPKHKNDVIEKYRTPFHVWIYYNNKIDIFLKWKLKNLFGEKKFEWLFKHKIKKIILELESRGFIQRTNGILYPKDKELNFKYKKNSFSLEGYFNVTDIGLLYLKNNAEKKLSDMNYILDIAKLLLKSAQ